MKRHSNFYKTAYQERKRQKTTAKNKRINPTFWDYFFFVVALIAVGYCCWQFLNGLM